MALNAAISALLDGCLDTGVTQWRAGTGLGCRAVLRAGLVAERGTPSPAVCGCFGAIATALHTAPAASLSA